MIERQRVTDYHLVAAKAGDRYNPSELAFGKPTSLYQREALRRL